MPNFKHAAFVRVDDAEQRKELIEWLEMVGYKLHHKWADNAESIETSRSGLFCQAHPGNIPSFSGYNCGTNIELFKAIAAINDENDRYHYYTCVRSYIDGCDCITANKGDIKFGDWETCTSNMSKNWVKATPAELIDHFKNK